MAAENRVSRLEKCDCHASSCNVNGIIREEGSRWEEGCESCKCTLGEVNCEPKAGNYPCKHPVKLRPGECPVCLSMCPSVIVDSTMNL